MRSILKSLIRAIALRTGKLGGLYIKVCKPMGGEYTEYVRRHGGLQGMGDHCSILPSTVFTDPAYVRLGNNVHFSTCALIGHDGSIAMLNRAYDVKLDAVGKIDIGDNVFIGYNAIVLPNVTIGSNVIVAAGAVVTKDVESGNIVAGVPARPIGRVDALVAKLQTQTAALPWSDLIQQRQGGFDPQLEPHLLKRRIAHFYGETASGRSPRSVESKRTVSVRQDGPETP
jgi:acetyltransferase-like isoleucine patch superfamily enzyme